MRIKGLLLLPLTAIIIACSNSARLVHVDQSSQSVPLMTKAIESRQEFYPSGSAISVPAPDVIEEIRMDYEITPRKEVNPKKEITGIASWYGKEFHGKETASSTPKKKKVFNMWGMTAACKKFPRGSEVKVTNTMNGRSVIVKITDHGPNKRGRLIDLSLGAFVKLGAREDAGIIGVKVSSL